MTRHLITYNWRIFTNKKSLFICTSTRNGRNWLVKEDITPDGENYYGGQGYRFIGMKIDSASRAVVNVSVYDKIDKCDSSTDDYLKRIGV